VSENPYAAPGTSDPMEFSEIDEIRYQHLNHEISLKSIGSLYCVSGILVMLVTVVSVLFLFTVKRVTVLLVSYAVLGTLAAFLCLWIGIGLRRLTPAVRVPALFISVVGLFLFPIGTLMSIYALYLLLEPKGKMVLSGQYQEVVAATPHIQYRTSYVVWIVLVIIIFVILFGWIAETFFS